jgi:glutamyl-tRNA synthetase
MNAGQRTTRLAPSPTGALHLGNARTFLATWAIARQRGWRIVLRIEDLDGPRIKPEAIQQALDDLIWLGLDWDNGPSLQSTDLARYRDAVAQLIGSSHAYPCICTRKEVELAASAPHAEDGAAVYSGTCRGRFASVDAARQASGREPAIRFRVPEETFRFSDDFAGDRAINLPAQIGDFVVAKGDGTPAYQLAVVVDDHRAGVTDVIRGDDLIESVARQTLLYRALGWGERVPTYCHLPLVIGEDGRRLAKRHGDTRLSTYRDVGVSAGRVRSLLARWLGIDAGDELGAREVVERIDLKQIARDPVVFTAADDRWLKG